MGEYYSALVADRGACDEMARTKRRSRIRRAASERQRAHQL